MTGGIRFTKGCSYLFFKWRIITLQGCVGFCQQQCKSAISIHRSPPCWTSPHPTPHHTPLGYHRAEGWAPWAIQQLSISCVLHMVMCMFQCYVSICLSLSLWLLCLQVCSLCGHLHSLKGYSYLHNLKLMTCDVSTSCDFIYHCALSALINVVYWALGSVTGWKKKM